jgi:asparagine synthase (glutamine-hydrolysing)
MPSHIDARSLTESPAWSNVFLWSDPAFSRLPLRFRHPFFDLRLVSFVQSIPPLPWLFDKRILRDALRGILPDKVVDRPKKLLARSPAQAARQQRGDENVWASFVRNHQSLERFVDKAKLCSAVEHAASSDRQSNLALTHSLSLALWLHHWRNPRARQYVLDRPTRGRISVRETARC